MALVWGGLGGQTECRNASHTGAVHGQHAQEQVQGRMEVTVQTIVTTMMPGRVSRYKVRREKKKKKGQAHASTRSWRNLQGGALLHQEVTLSTEEGLDLNELDKGKEG